MKVSTSSYEAEFSTPSWSHLDENHHSFSLLALVRVVLFTYRSILSRPYYCILFFYRDRQDRAQRVQGVLRHSRVAARRVPLSVLGGNAPLRRGGRVVERVEEVPQEQLLHDHQVSGITPFVRRQQVSSAVV